MPKTKVYKKGVWYYKVKNGFYGLMLGEIRKAGKPQNFCVLETRSTPGREHLDRKVVKEGTLTECRNYMKERFDRKK